MCSSMWVLDVQKAPPSLALSAQIAGQQAAAASLECAAQLAAAAWRSSQPGVVCTTVGALLNGSFESLGNGRQHTSQHQQVRCSLDNAAVLGLVCAKKDAAIDDGLWWERSSL